MRFTFLKEYEHTPVIAVLFYSGETDPASFVAKNR